MLKHSLHMLSNEFTKKYTLEPVSDEHLYQLCDWLGSHDDAISWGGPNIRFPIEASKLKDDISFYKQATRVLISENLELVGFGQYYERLAHLHLARLIIAPKHRGQGHIKTLVELLVNKGHQELGTKSESLFILQANKAAIAAYAQMGFKTCLYPEPMPIKNCLYMTRSARIQVVHSEQMAVT